MWDFLKYFAFFPPKMKLPKYEPFEWYHEGNWWDHPIYRDFKK